MKLLSITSLVISFLCTHVINATGTNQPPLFDIVIVSHSKDYETLPLCLESIKKNIPGHNRIFIIGNKEVLNDLFTFVHENKFYQYINPHELRKNWAKVKPIYADRAFWIFQQLLKLGASLLIDGLSENYLVIDSDIMWVKPQKFFDENNRFILSRYHHTTGTHQPYIGTYKKIVGQEPPLMKKFSFICHHMLFNQKVLNELFTHIENLHNKPWYQVIIDCCDFNEASSFSEYETYGNWLFAHHEDKMTVRKLIEQLVKEVPWNYEKYQRCDIVAAHWWERNKTLCGYPS